MLNLCFVLLLFLIGNLAGCSWFNPEPPPSRAELARDRRLDNPASEVAVEPFTSALLTEGVADKNKVVEFGVELTWEVPQEPVEGFVLYTGQNPDNLNTEIHLALSDIQTVAEGTKFRYVIKPVSSRETFYVALAAQYQGQVSERSPVQRIEPEPIEASTLKN